MYQRNSLTKFQADALYEPKVPVVRRDLLDNNVEYIVVGDRTVDRRIQVEYSFELPIGDRAQTGVIVLVQERGFVDRDHHYSFNGPELDEVEFEADVSGNDIRLVITTNGLGENPVIKYRRTSLDVV